MDNINYDYIIIGGGPTGLTLAWILSSQNKKILLIEKESVLGGCHRVARVDGYFSEHGPRVYSNSYLMFNDLLNDMNLDFNQLFVEYKSNISNIDNKTILSLNFNEKFALIQAFIKMIFNSNYGKNISIKTFMKNNNFTDESIDYIERLCRLTDGASADDYTLFQFLQLLNQQLFYKLYQPRITNDKGLIKEWENKLKSNKVKILLNTELVKINQINNKVSEIAIMKNKVQSIIKVNKLVLAIPPKPLYNILNSSEELKNSFILEDLKNSNNVDKLKQWKSKNSYFDYISLTFHYKSNIKLNKYNGFPRTPWGIGFIVVSEYMDFSDEPSKQCISICISMTDVKNEYNKTANESTLDEISFYVQKQLSIFPKPDKVIFSQQVVRSDNKWINLDTAYVITSENNFLNYKSKIENLYAIGIFNGNSNYHFTSLESSVQNAIHFCIQEFPDLKYKYKMKYLNEVKYVIYDILFIIIIILLIILIKNRKILFNLSINTIKS